MNSYRTDLATMVSVAMEPANMNLAKINKQQYTLTDGPPSMNLATLDSTTMDSITIDPAT
jgi:hypothetical protein